MHHDPKVIRIYGTIGLICAVVPIVTDVVSWFLANGYSPVENSISDLAVGPHSWLMDLGLWVFVISCFAVAAGLWAWRGRAKWWTAAIISLALTGICAGILAPLQDYAGRNPGLRIHLWAVTGLGLFFLATCWLAVPGLRTISDRLAWLSAGLGAVWVVLSPYYWFGAPESWSGAVEPVLALIMIGWLVAISRRMRRSPERLPAH